MHGTPLKWSGPSNNRMWDRLLPQAFPADHDEQSDLVAGSVSAEP